MSVLLHSRFMVLPLLTSDVPCGHVTLVAAMHLVLELHGLVLELAGAAGVAAAMVFRDKFRGDRVATLLSGGNRNL